MIGLSMNTIQKIKRDIIDINSGERDGIEYCTIMFGDPFTNEELHKFKKYKSVVAAGTAHYRYAPEIKHSYIVIKGGITR